MEKKAKAQRSRIRALFRLLPTIALLASACQSILGIESYTRKPDGADAGGCLRPSDCAGSQVCLFQTCSEPCLKDKDCAPGTYCLQTDGGTACVSTTQAQCGDTQSCPAGTTCSAGRCQTTCTAAGATCPGGQQCSGGVCESSVPNTGGGGGSGMSNGGGGRGGGLSQGGNPNVGAAGAPEPMGAAGVVGVDDGTAIGTPDAPCQKSGAFACDGHAQRGELVCQGGVWQSNGACSSSTLCDSTPGGNAGSCQPVIPECQDQAAGHRFCRVADTDARECGVDLVTASVVESCMYVCAAGACTGTCHPKDKQCKAGGLVPQTCDDSGGWQDDPACGYKCDSTSGKCLAAGCGDGVKNGDETDTDCGGSCTGCPISGACKLDSDCIAPTSARCVGGKCAAATCSDGVKNGAETDKDCGGTSCGRCAVGLTCSINTDCLLPDSGHCSATKCVAASCIDGLKNGTETDKDCGGPCAADCAVGLGCGADTDCASAACLANACVTCKPTTKQCVGTTFETCSTTGAWGTPVACTVTNGAPSCSGAGVCTIANCNAGYGNCDGVLGNGCETNLNDTAACGTTCAGRPACSTVNGAPTCVNGVCGMNCSSGYGDCTGNNDGCETQLNIAANCGTCAHTAVCTVPAKICSNGSCVDNTPYAVGQGSATGAGWSEFDPPVGMWYVVPVFAPKNATVQSMQVIGNTNTPGGGQARMALWADDGNGHPGAYIADTGNIIVAPGPTPSGLAPVPLATQVTGGKTYWVGAKFGPNASLLPHLYQSVSSGLVGYTYMEGFGVNPATSIALMPFPWMSAPTFSNTALNIFLSVQDIPP